MSNFVITLSRQFGSLGRPIAQQLSEILGIEYYDRDIIGEVAKATKAPISTIKKEEETASSSYFSSMQFPLGNNTTATQDVIFEAEKKIIENLVEKQNCIIVGRLAEFILKDYQNVLNIFIYAPYKARVQNCINALFMNEQEAERMIKSVDQARDTYHKKYTGYVASDYKHYHLMIDASRLGPTGTAQELSSYIKSCFPSSTFKASYE